MEAKIMKSSLSKTLGAGLLLLGVLAFALGSLGSCYIAFGGLFSLLWGFPMKLEASFYVLVSSILFSGMGIMWAAVGRKLHDCDE